jgi:hypothetical protein
MPIADSLRTPGEHADDMRVARNLTNSSLTEIQALLYRLITAPQGVAAGLIAEGGAASIEDLIESDERMTASERLEIYARGYFFRILDALREDFPATLRVVGADNFHNLITDYLIEHPPTESSISQVGRHLADFLRTHPMRERWPFIGELAYLERTLIEVFQASDADTVSIEQMRQVPPVQWPAIALRTHPALAIIDCEWRVDELLRELESNAGEYRETSATPVKNRVSVLVWRKNSRVHYRAIEPDERAGLKLAASGARFGSVCEAVAEFRSGTDQVATVERLMTLLARWIEDGLIIPADEISQRKK